jgi:hypothetical protein
MKKEFGNHLPRSAAFKTKEGHLAVPTQKYTLGKVCSSIPSSLARDRKVYSTYSMK